MRLRRNRVICSATLVAACVAAPAPALAGDSGGAVAPVGTDGGGGAYGAAPPAPEKPSADAGKRAATKRAARERAARQRAAKQRAARRRAARLRARRRAERQRTTSPAPAPAPSEDGHVFPVAGPYTLGGDGAVFGAPRSGHRHQGHDITAALGTPVLAPYAGVIEWVRFQRAGAGHYVVLDGEGEDRDYVFMHLRRGSIPVVPGQLVAAGDQIGEVGNSGSSSGPHLHFEIWTGGWYEKGGRPIDPLPLLQQWAG